MYQTELQLVGGADESVNHFSYLLELWFGHYIISLLHNCSCSLMALQERSQAGSQVAVSSDYTYNLNQHGCPIMIQWKGRLQNTWYCCAVLMILMSLLQDLFLSESLDLKPPLHFNVICWTYHCTILNAYFMAECMKDGASLQLKWFLSDQKCVQMGKKGFFFFIIKGVLN